MEYARLLDFTKEARTSHSHLFGPKQDVFTGLLITEISSLVVLCPTRLLRCPRINGASYFMPPPWSEDLVNPNYYNVD